MCIKNSQTSSEIRLFAYKKPGGDLLSHGETPYYHRRCVISLPSSEWDRVVPTRYGRQANCLSRNNPAYKFWNSVYRIIKLIEYYMVKPHGQLVPVSFMRCRTSTPGLSTLSSSRALQGNQVPVRPNLGAGFPLRCFQRLSLPYIATRQCHWHDNRNTRGTSTPVLSY